MAGRLDQSGLASEGVREVLDLCLECRACKAECPVGVDVARFKSEFLADYWRRHGTPVHARAMAHIHRLSALATPFAPLVNAVAGSAPGRWINEHLLGIDRRRTPPRFVRDTFRRQFARRLTTASPSTTSPTTSSPIPPIPKPQSPVPVRVVDTFTNFTHPSSGMDAAAVLTAAGCGVQVVPHGCCGRPMISKGLLDDARTAASANADALYDAAARGEPIVFLEPSCLSAVKDDAPALLRGDAQRKARVVAGACVLFEEYLEQQWKAGRVALDLTSGPARVLLHGHCHQKAMGLLPPARALLSRIPGATVVDLDAGCCGMAGSFGYAREHYDVSRAIGERKLLPAARAMTADTVLVAPGTSCREQVRHFTGGRALHPAELLRSSLAPTREIAGSPRSKGL
jgi:Fe-S oxidoreductase